MKTIARINSEGIIFQVVSSFKLVRNKDISSVPIADIKHYSDWVQSGDVMNADFSWSTGLDYRFDFQMRDIGLGTGLTDRLLRDSDLDEIRKQITTVKRIDKKVSDDLYELNLYANSAPVETVLQILFKRFNVIGGTVSVTGRGYVFDEFSSETIATILETIKNDRYQMAS